MARRDLPNHPPAPQHLQGDHFSSERHPQELRVRITQIITRLLWLLSLEIQRTVDLEDRLDDQQKHPSSQYYLDQLRSRIFFPFG
jgi:hypothetical protein